MSKRAEKAALKAYPYDYPERDGYRKGYEQVEKDLALTIDDLEAIHTFLYVVKNNKTGCFTFTRLSDEQYEEVLKRFNRWKEEQK